MRVWRIGLAAVFTAGCAQIVGFDEDYRPLDPGAGTGSPGGSGGISSTGGQGGSAQGGGGLGGSAQGGGGLGGSAQGGGGQGGSAGGMDCTVMTDCQVLEVVAGSYHSCARLSGGIVKCWGYNASGSLGQGDQQDRGDGPGEMGGNLPAVDLGTGNTATAVAAGENHTCALLNDNSVKCWGKNDLGQLGVGDAENRGDGPNEMGNNLPPVDLGTGKTATAIATGGLHTCALLNDSTIKCWGSNNFGQLGQGHQTPIGDGLNEMGNNLNPVALGTGTVATAVAARGNYTCAVLNEQIVKCWGFNNFGQLGLGDVLSRGDELNEMGDDLAPVNLGTGKTAKVVTAGEYHACAPLNDDTVRCWGRNSFGELGLGDVQHRGDGPNEMGDSLPTVSLTAGKTAIAIAAGGIHTCATLNNGTVQCWGYNASGELGQGNTQDIGDNPNEMGDNLAPVMLGNGKMVSTTSTGSFHTCTLLNDSTMKCWGFNGSGRLGLGGTETRGDNPNEMGDNLPTVKLFSDLW